MKRVPGFIPPGTVKMTKATGFRNPVPNPHPGGNHMERKPTYESPLGSRYASREMLYIF